MRVQKFPNLSKISTNVQKIFTAFEQCDNQLIIQSWTHAGIQPIIENGVVTHVEINATGILDGEVVADLQEEETNEMLRGRRPNKAPWGLMNAEQLERVQSGLCPYCGSEMPNQEHKDH